MQSLKYKVYSIDEITARLGIIKEYVCKLEYNTKEFINKEKVIYKLKHQKKGEINKQYVEEPNIAS